MITTLDDYSIHQTTLALAVPATSDRNFYDRICFMFNKSARSLRTAPSNPPAPSNTARLAAMRRAGSPDCTFCIN